MSISEEGQKTYTLDHICSILLQSFLESRDLSCVGSFITIDICPISSRLHADWWSTRRTDSWPDLHVNLGILDRLHDQCGVVAVGTVETKAGGKL